MIKMDSTEHQTLKLEIIILPDKKHLVNSYHIIPHTCNNPNTGAINAVMKCVIKTEEK